MRKHIANSPGLRLLPLAAASWPSCTDRLRTRAEARMERRISLISGRKQAPTGLQQHRGRLCNRFLLLRKRGAIAGPLSSGTAMTTARAACVMRLRTQAAATRSISASCIARGSH